MSRKKQAYSEEYAKQQEAQLDALQHLADAVDSLVKSLRTNNYQSREAERRLGPSSSAFLEAKKSKRRIK